MESAKHGFIDPGLHITPIEPVDETVDERKGYHFGSHN
jgi:hypothetical protein